MILGWISLAVIIILMLSLCTSFVRIMRAEYCAQPRRVQVRPQASSSRLQRTFRVIIEPILGR